MRGERDAFVSPAWNETIARLMPHARHATIPRAAHAANYSRPEALVALVRPFLQGMSPAIERPPPSVPAVGTSRAPDEWSAGNASPTPKPAAAPTITSVGK